MKYKKEIEFWKQEESIAHIKGWDFSHINQRYTEETDLPWDYQEIVLSYLNKSSKLLDIDTGGGEFLLTLNHPYSKTSCTERFAPNVVLCKERLLPLGIDFKEAQGTLLPFKDHCFDIVINRHGDYDVNELWRILKPGGLFITEQVGKENDKELVELLLPNLKTEGCGSNLTAERSKFKERGFTVLTSEEAYRPIKFYDVGALVWYARIIEWEFAGFSVESCLDQLLEARKILDEKGLIAGTIHRYLIVARK